MLFITVTTLLNIIAMEYWHLFCINTPNQNPNILLQLFLSVCYAIKKKKNTYDLNWMNCLVFKYVDLYYQWNWFCFWIILIRYHFYKEMQLSLVDLSHSLEPCWVIVSGNSFILSFWLSGYVFMPSANVVHLYCHFNDDFFSCLDSNCQYY